jgi:3-phosphoshikimate 1-carboxyvinyltransferase
MNINITPSKLSGTVAAVPSKSAAHRALICTALSSITGGGGNTDTVDCAVTSKDIDATRECLTALLAHNTLDSKPLVINPNESGSTFRFLLPIVAALGITTEFELGGRLPQRPLSPLYEELVKQGCTLSPQGSNPFTVKGRLHAGHFIIDAGVSSQFISGLLFALPLLKGHNAVSTIRLWGKAESMSYVELTTDMLNRFGIKYSFDGTCYVVSGNQKYTSPEKIEIEGDWSNSAFWLCASRLHGDKITVTGLDENSKQGDRAVVRILKTNPSEIDVSDIPDLLPILAVTAAFGQGVTTFTNAARLRLKESDRLAAMSNLLTDLGVRVNETEDTLTVHGTETLNNQPVTVNCYNDHRIAMSAAIAATKANAPVIIEGAEAVEKSYPHFFEDLRRLNGVWEIV